MREILLRLNHRKENEPPFARYEPSVQRLADSGLDIIIRTPGALRGTPGHPITAHFADGRIVEVDFNQDGITSTFNETQTAEPE